MRIILEVRSYGIGVIGSSDNGEAENDRRGLTVIAMLQAAGTVHLFM